MAKKEAQTDIWVYELLKSADIELCYQSSDIPEIDKALKTASKADTGKAGKPEFIGVVKDFVLVIENKANIANHERRDKHNNLLGDTESKQAYALNGALHYGRHIIQHTSYKKVIAIGVSGDEKRHRITPIFIDEGLFPQELGEVETFISFNKANIDHYYHRKILQRPSEEGKTTAEILKDAETLHEMLWKGGLTNQEKPLVVSGILLALREESFKGFSIDDLTGDTVKSDGKKIYDAIEANLTRANVSPTTKRDKILAQFAVIRDNRKINDKNPKSGRTLLREYTEFLRKSIHRSILDTKSADDYLGLFYGEFMSYSGKDGQNLGIVLTPKHITELFCDLVSLRPTDRVLDPCCGTGGFLIAAMHAMLEETTDSTQQRSICKEQLMGIELQDYMFTIATTNMILRGDGKSNLLNLDFLAESASKIQKEMHCTVGMMNPPYSQGSKDDPEKYEIAFTEHLLNSLSEDARAIVIIPQSSVTGKTTTEKDIKRNILKYHTLEGVITLNNNTFFGVGTNPCIAIFTAGVPHPKGKKCKFINFEDDGLVVEKHVGLVDNGTAHDRRQHLLDVWHGRTEAHNKFCVETTIEAEDEWLHSFYYFNDEIPSEEDFRKTMADYLTFQFNMITHGRGYLFKTPTDDE
nr:N-6 DNA methylase [uncultured Porphyromonas sp.]